MSTSFAEQLAQPLQQWAEDVVREASETMLERGQQLAPLGETGETVESGRVEQSGTHASLTFDDRGYTDEGPTAHRIDGNPLLVFDWPAQGLMPAAFRHVFWTPGEGVARNRGWFTERTATPELWEQDLLAAAERVPFS